MKKIASILLSGALVISMAACGQSGSGSQSSSGSGAASGSSSSSSSETTQSTESSSSANEQQPSEPELAYPEKDITIIVPYDAGGGNDVLARILAKVAMENKYFNGANIVVENQPGGGGAIGQTYVAKTAEPDGYTLLTFTGSTITNPILKDVTFTVDEFNIIVGCNPDPAVLLAGKDAPYNTIEEFIEYAMNNEVLITDSGFGTNSHIRGLGMNSTLTDKYNKPLNLKEMHTDSSKMQLTQIMGGHADVTIATVGECAEAVLNGEVKAIGLMATGRSETLPDVPTFKEAGYEGIIDGADRCIACRADVPDDIYQYLVSEFGKLCASDEFVTAMKDAGMTPAAKTPQEMNEYIQGITDKVTALKDYLLSGNN